jgi:hypothetical protein
LFSRGEIGESNRERGRPKDQNLSRSDAGALPRTSSQAKATFAIAGRKQARVVWYIVVMYCVSSGDILFV